MTILSTVPLDFQWPTIDPFLFCVHHLDNYPAGMSDLSPKGSLTGRNIGSDFSGKDGWSMYHGENVPGFPRHPHRGFETITIARKGFIDHSDSMGAQARFGHGDVQWMTAGKGISHSEMFPLLNSETSNPTELFQIWINLPASDKFVTPYFTMFWRDTIPTVTVESPNGKKSFIQIIAGQFEGVTAPLPPPNSWASRVESDIAIYSITMEANSEMKLPKTKAETNRILYFFTGKSITINGSKQQVGHGIQVSPTFDLEIINGSEDSEILILQASPIGEPVVKYGPFVMNTKEEIQQAYQDYQQTKFGDWSWDTNAPTHSDSKERFAIHADGRSEHAG
jgi:redox-sensitive bicupin YhaK (pirin superfamily)